MTDILDSLSTKRVFRVFIPDISLQEAQRNDPYVLRMQVPAGSQFLGVLQISSPMAGMGMLAGAPQVAYAFLCNPEEEDTRNIYVTAVFSEMPFPWHARCTSAPSLEECKSGFELDHPQAAFCSPLGITSHNGVPLLHVRVDVHVSDYVVFEAELLDAGYRIVKAKTYVQSEALIELYKAHAKKGSASPSNEGEVGS